MQGDYLTGEKELLDKLEKIKRNLDVKEVRKAGMKALTPAVRALKAAAPIGSVEHRSYKGNWLTPGYLSRKGVRKRSKIENGKVNLFIDLKPEAFYGQFIERGFKSYSPHRWFYITWARVKYGVMDDYIRQLKKMVFK